MSPLTAVQAPQGAHFEFEVVKTAHGEKDLGPAPLLIWDDLEAARAFYGDEAILGILDGTSLRVSFQGTARRGRIKGESDDDIAKKQLEFRPGTRAVGVSTPVSRAARAAKQAADKLGGTAGDTIAAFLERVAKGELSEDDLRALVK